MIFFMLNKTSNTSHYFLLIQCVIKTKQKLARRLSKTHFKIQSPPTGKEHEKIIFPDIL